MVRVITVLVDARDVLVARVHICRVLEPDLLVAVLVHVVQCV